MAADRHVVIADDSKRAQLFVSTSFRNAGFIVDGLADDGKQAIALCRQFKPDLVMLDISMPVMNGLDAARTIKAENLARHVIIVSSNIHEGFKAQARAIGAHIVGKSNDGHHLMQMVGQQVAEFRRGA